VGRKFVHYDGSKCRLEGDTWVITQLSPMPYQELTEQKVGDPCRFCNRFNQDTVRRGLFQYFIYRMRSLARLQFTSTSFAIFVIGIGCGQWAAMLIDLVGIAHVGVPKFLAVDVAGLPPATALIALGLDYVRWSNNRCGAPDRS
jgi:hypothetical protein